MRSDSLDRIDEGILYYLQRDARNATTTDMGERLDVAGSTIRNRIERLEADGILRGYRPTVGYEAAGLSLHVVFTCTAPDASDDLAERLLDRYGVVRVYELLADEANVRVEAVGEDARDVTHIADSLREAGLEIVRSDVVTDRCVRPYNHFTEDDFESEDDLE